MKKLGLFIVAVLVLSFLAIAKEIVLQNGANYAGCVDTYISMADGQGAENKNFGGGAKLVLEGYH